MVSVNNVLSIVIGVIVVRVLASWIVEYDTYRITTDPKTFRAVLYTERSSHLARVSLRLENHGREYVDVSEMKLVHPRSDKGWSVFHNSSYNILDDQPSCSEMKNVKVDAITHHIKYLHPHERLFLLNVTVVNEDTMEYVVETLRRLRLVMYDPVFRSKTERELEYKFVHI